MKLYAAIMVVLAALVPALAFIAAGAYAGAVPAGLLGAVCLVGQRRAWPWTPPACLLGFTACAAAGIWLGLPPLWMLLGTVAALAAWDLLELAQRLESVQHSDAAARFARAHALYLAGVCALALLLGVIAAWGSLPLGFGWAVLLGAVALLGLLRVVTVLRAS